MAEDSVKRKLRAILSADVKDYSRMMGEDEVGTYQTLTAKLEAIRSIISEHNGRVFSSPGDAVMAELSSVVDAVQCAVELQEKIEAANAEVSEGRKMQFRIGVNLGDVIHDGEQVYGDGVNIAARIEALAEPGGVSISRNVYNNVHNKLKFGYEYQGEHQVKNIAEPVRVYKVLTAPEHAGQLIGEAKAPKRLSKQSYIAIFAVLVLIVAAAFWQFYPRAPEMEPASVDKIALEKPSIAVLPFDNMSDDPDQEYFCDGMTEDIITDLSKLSGLFVISRNSVFLYKGKAVKPTQVSRELGVRYILEGSVRKAGNMIRINAQLIDSKTEGHLWAERYDGKMEDIFSMQDNVTHNIIKALQVRLTKEDQDKTGQTETDSIEAYNTFLKGWEHYVKHTAKDFSEALAYFKKAVEIDPDYSRAYAALALIHKKAAEIGHHIEMGLQWDKAQLMPRQYLKIAIRSPSALSLNVASEIYLRQRQYKEAFLNAKNAIALDPNDSESQLVMAEVLIMDGKPDEALAYVKNAMLLDPLNKARPFYLLGLSRFSFGHLEEAAILFEKAHALIPEAYLWSGPHAATYAHLGKSLEAKATLKNFVKFSSFCPNLNEAMFYFPFKNHTVADRLAAGLIKAGLKSKTSRYIKVSEEDRLSGEEIRKLLFGSVRTGFSVDFTDNLIEEEITKNGKSIKRDTQYSVGDNIGTSWIEKNMLCNRYHDIYQAGLERCGPIFRNPHGTKKLKNEYVWITESFPWEWSIGNE